MSHQELYQDKHCLIYVRQLSEQVTTIWYENALGEARSCLTLTLHADNSYEMQIPLQSLSMQEFKLWKDQTERWLREQNPGVRLVFGYTTIKMGEFLILSDSRVRWCEDRIQVGNNQKQRLEWDLSKREG